MKTVVINGQNHKGSTWHIGKLLADKIGGELTEFFLPRDFSDYCKAFFSVMRILQSKGGFSKPDAEYWKAMGWTGNKRPWK